MTNVLVAYSSMTGNTEEIAERIVRELSLFDFTIKKIEMDYLDGRELLKYDGILLGSYTYGDGDLPFEAEAFYDDLADLDLTGKKAAVFGSGDSAYSYFCKAVEIFEEQLKGSHTTIVEEGLKMERNPETEDEFAKCCLFAQEFGKALLK